MGVFSVSMVIFRSASARSARLALGDPIGDPGFAVSKLDLPADPALVGDGWQLVWLDGFGVEVLAGRLVLDTGPVGGDDERDSVEGLGLAIFARDDDDCVWRLVQDRDSTGGDGAIEAGARVVVWASLCGEAGLGDGGIQFGWHGGDGSWWAGLCLTLQSISDFTLTNRCSVWHTIHMDATTTPNTVDSYLATCAADNASTAAKDHDTGRPLRPATATNAATNANRVMPCIDDPANAATMARIRARRAHRNGGRHLL